MGKIRNIYIVNHSHTDIGFTDFQDLCYRQHREFIDQAIDLCEATASYPEEARYRWTCEVTGMTERWFKEASPEQIARYIALQEQGAIDTAGILDSCSHFGMPAAHEATRESRNASLAPARVCAAWA